MPNNGLSQGDRVKILRRGPHKDREGTIVEKDQANRYWVQYDLANDSKDTGKKSNVRVTASPYRSSELRSI